jgi:HTH-type transcriptional regulator/antitoxin HipB
MGIDTEFIIEEHVIVEAKQLPALAKILRQHEGLTQHEMGEKIGISQKTFSSLERGLNVANFSRVLELLELLGYQIVIRKKTNQSQNQSNAAGSPRFLD